MKVRNDILSVQADFSLRSLFCMRLDKEPGLAMFHINWANKPCYDKAHQTQQPTAKPTMLTDHNNFKKHYKQLAI